MLETIDDEEVYFGAFNNFRNQRRIKQSDDVVMLPVDKLVPFYNRSFKMFKGRRLEEMVESVRAMGVVEPIKVQRKSDGTIEILNGHYRVAAATRLKIDKVPAIVYEGLSFDEALLCVSETSPIGLFCKYNIEDLTDREADSYKNIQNARVFIDDSFSMALDEYIERYLLTKDEATNTYESKYDMGNPYDLTDTECQYIELADEIKEKSIGKKEQDEIRQLKESKAPADKDRLGELECKIADEALKLVDTFTQSNGYTDQLKKYLNLDFDAFDDGIRNKREKAKILYFLYMLKTRDFPKTNVLMLLSKQSIENIDNSFLGRETSNGRFLRVIKLAFEKEISQQAKNNIKGALSFVSDVWSGLILNTLGNIEHFARNECDLDGIISSLQSGLHEEFQYVSSDKHGVPLSPIETLYLRVSQSEYLAQVRDILKVLDNQDKSEYNVPQELVEEMKKYHSREISSDGLEEFLSADNVQEISKYVFLKPETDKEERRKIRNSRDKLLRFWDFCNLVELDISANEKLSELLIISCLQSIMLDDQSEIFDYTFHGFEDTDGKRKGKIHVQAALKNNKRTYEALQMYWVRKVIDRFYANIGRYDFRCKFREFEKACYRILERILSCHTIDEMLMFNQFYQEKLNKN